MKNQVARDLGRHFRDRVGQVVDDSLDTMDRARVSWRDATTVVLAQLLMHASVMAIVTGIRKEDFLEVCSDCYSKMKVASRDEP